MSCEQRPSVTLWGTTQVTTLTTVLSTITNPSAHRVTSSITETTCDGDGNCGPLARPTVIVDKNELSFETVTTETVVTNVIPVQTRYYPCPEETTTTPQPQSSATSAVASSTANTDENSLTVSTVPAPSTTSTTTLPSSGPPVRASVASTSLSRETSSSTHTTTDEHSASVAWSTAGDNDGTAATHSIEPSTTMDPAGVGSGGAAPSSPSSTDSSSIGANEIVGIVLGSITALVFLGLLVYKYRTRSRRGLNEGDHQETYWERRFQELEGGGEKPVEGLTPTSPPEDEGTHHKHISLNLASHHPTIYRPASRLSQISSFFGGANNRNSPEPSRLAMFRNRHAIDFSRPREEGDRFSFRSFGKAASVKSTRSGVDRRTSNWPFTGVVAAVAGSIKGRPGSVKSASNASENQRPIGAGPGTEGRKGMEWIRTIVSSDSEFGFNRSNDSTSPSGNGRGLPPPPRSRGVSPLPALSDTATAGTGTTEGQPRLSAFPEARPDSAPAPPMYEARSEDQPIAAAAATDSRGRQLYPSNSLRKKRQHKGLPVPDLELNRDAISPNLWIDDEALDKFGRNQLSPRRRSRDQQAIQAATATATATAAVSTPPLTITKKDKPPAPPAPSAFNAPDLTSRFSPDSSRGSFSTLQQDRPRRGSQTSGKEVPSVPATHNPQRDDAPIDGEQPRKLERSAVTPQLPTLATSNADAFRAEMAELSASTGESERVERVMSFHGGK